MVKLIASGIGAVIFLIIALGTFFTVDQGERAVVLRYGQVIREGSPGFNFKLPLVDSVEHFSVQDQTLTWEKLAAYSRDQQPAHLKVSVTYRLTDPLAVYAHFGSAQSLVDRLIAPRTPSAVENVFGQFDAIRAVQERTELVANLQKAITSALAGEPVQIQSVQIENIDFSDTYEKAVESRMQAIVQQQQAEAQKQKRIIDADAAAYEVRAQADAAAHATEVNGKAEATAIRARADALQSNPGLVALTSAERWNGVLPSTMVPGSSVPFVNVGGH